VAAEPLEVPLMRRRKRGLSRRWRTGACVALAEKTAWNSSWRLAMLDLSLSCRGLRGSPAVSLRQLPILMWLVSS